MKTKFAAIIGMIMIMSSAALPAQAAAMNAMQNGPAAPGSAALWDTIDFRHLGNGWNYREGFWYYVRGGRAVTGWVKDAGKWYFLSRDGKMKTGWVKVDGKWYYLEKSGAMKTGWLRVGGKFYYLTKSGAMKTGWLRLDGKWYYMNAKGERMTGWVRIDGKWHYMRPNGEMMRMCGLRIGDKLYYLTKSGARATGWVTINGKQYCFRTDGSLDREQTRKANVKPSENAAQEETSFADQSAGKKDSAADSKKASEDSKKDTAPKNTAKKKKTVVHKKTMGEQVAEYALQFVGNPYVYGGCSLTNGTDCSGFVMLIYQHFGISLPHYDAAIRQKGTHVPSLSEARPGDVVCYYGHVAIYLGDGRIVHASNSRDGIKISERADYRTIAAIRRMFD